MWSDLRHSSFNLALSSLRALIDWPGNAGDKSIGDSLARSSEQELAQQALDCARIKLKCQLWPQPIKGRVRPSEGARQAQNTHNTNSFRPERTGNGMEPQNGQTEGDRRMLGARGSKQQQRGRQRSLEELVAERMGVAREVQLFGDFEELSRLYAIEAPPQARTQIELVFDVYDGHKIGQETTPDGGAEAEEEEQEETMPASGVNLRQEQQKRVGWKRKRGNNFSWCKFLFNRNKCCLSSSETVQEFLMSPSSSLEPATNLNQEPLCAALAPDLDDDQEAATLKEEAIGLVEPFLERLRRSSTVSEQSRMDQSVHSGFNEQQQVFLDASTNQGQISVCLYDKRKREAELRLEARNGKRWARARRALAELERRAAGARLTDELEERASKLLSNRHLDSMRLEAKRGEKLNRQQVECLVQLTKNSLNQLIDAQLLLRNKLASSESKPNEYESLLRNNFNLLKIWQNLEETKELVCFVCEPVKANLADLFHFSRRRPPAGSCCNCLLPSPLVCLDAVQVKRGLLQILEALHYLHATCKLIHRNLTPGNILIAGDLNWKLSGLEFALRFESSARDSSAPTETLLRYSSGADTKSALRRQRTLHQTKCDEVNKRRADKHSPLLQPDLDYLAPEMWKSAKCSHKSDVFSFALILGQTYDLARHKPPLTCNRQAASYELALKRLTERRKRKLASRVPHEMRLLLLEMLDEEPALRPSAEYALQLLRRPLELCPSNEHSLRHLRSSLAFMDARWLQQQQLSHGSQPARPRSYFRKVTASNRSSGSRLPPNLHLLNLLLRALDSVSPPRGEQHFESLARFARQTLESLESQLADDLASDARTLMLVLALHRRLLEQVARMRQELPPVSRLTAAAQQASRAAQNHRQLSELEQQLHALICRRSLPLLALTLSDPLLKLDEFLLVHELANDLLAFTGQKCRTDFIQRGKHLLNELTPVTGCPSLSSSDEDSERSDPCTRSANQLSRQVAELTGKSNGSSGAMSQSGNKNEFEDYFGSGRSGARLTACQPTRISITAPSPMGSTRDMNRMVEQSVGQQQVVEQLAERASQLSLTECNEDTDSDQEPEKEVAGRSRSQLIDELLKTINDDSFNDFVDFNNKCTAQTGGQQKVATAAQAASVQRPKSAMDGATSSGYSSGRQVAPASESRPRSLALGGGGQRQQQTSKFDNVIRRMSTNLVQNLNKMSANTLGALEQQPETGGLRREKSSGPNSLYVDNQAPVRRHSDNTINIPRIQVALSSPQAGNSRLGVNQRASVSASKLANKWKLSTKANQREANDKLSPNLGGALGYMRRHSSGNTTSNEPSQSNGQTSNLLFNASPFKTRSSSNLGLDFLLSNRSMKRRCSAASMLGHQTQRKAENLIDAGMKSVQNMFS